MRALAVIPFLLVACGGGDIDLSGTWPKLSVAEAYERAKRYMPANLSDADFDKLTPEQIKKLRQADVNRFKTERRPTKAASTTSKKPVGMSTDDFFAMKDKQFSKR